MPGPSPGKQLWRAICLSNRKRPQRELSDSRRVRRFDDSGNGSGLGLVTLRFLASLAVQYTLVPQPGRAEEGETAAALPPRDTLATAHLTAATAIAAGFTLLWAATSHSRRHLVSSRPLSDEGGQILKESTGRRSD